MVEATTGEVANEGRHAVLDIEEVGLNIGVQEALEERAIEESDIAIAAHAGCRQLVGIADQQDLLHSCLQSNQQVRLRSLSGLVDY